MRHIAGVSGSLFPSGYLMSALSADAALYGATPPLPAVVRRVAAIWERASRTCGPASGLRTLFDLVAEPLLNALGFTVCDLAFGRSQATAVVVTPGGGRLALLLLSWATSASSAWRDAFRAARANETDWALVFAPPFLSLVSVAGAGAGRRLDFSLPVVVSKPVGPFWTLLHAPSHDRPAGQTDGGSLLTRLIARAEGYQGEVRRDLQMGVMDALDELEKAMGHRVRPVRAAERTRASRDQALTLVYRILFLLFAESRELVPLQHPVYGPSYSMGQLAAVAMRGATAGCWESLGAMTRLARMGCRSRSLVVTPFGGHLFERASAPDVEGRPPRPSARARFSERDLAASRALARLAARRGPAGLEAISYRDLGVEQLGAVYERLLDAPSGQPSHDGPGRQARPPAGCRRKTTGTFYTPQALAEFIVRRTLAPLVRGVPADAILRVRVLDPAMGSGACLIAACRYLATAYEEALITDGAASAADFDEGTRADVRRLIAERCLAGVDANPTAVELARLSLWLATLSFGKPLGFLDHRLRTGNSLIGAWPDDLAHVTANRKKATAARPLLEGEAIEQAIGRVCRPLADLLAQRDDTLEAVHAKAALWRQLTSPTSPLARWRRAATMWCARWFWPDGTPPAPAELRALIDAVLTGERTLPSSHVRARTSAAEAAETTHAFFHWPLEFPDVFYDSSGQPLPTPGFDAVIGNPPWEMLRQDRGREGSDARAVQTFLRESGQYPSCDRGHLNLYQAFIDRALALTRVGGRVGLVVPWGLASDDGAHGLRRRLLDTCRMDTLVGLDNARGLFAIHRGMRFAAFTATPGPSTTEIRCRFGIATAEELDRLPEIDDPAASEYPVRLTRRVIDTIGGPTTRIPDVRDPRLLDLVEKLFGRFKRLSDPTGWHVTFGRELNATEARAGFGPRGLPIVDGKHIRPFATMRSTDRYIERASALAWLPRAPFDHPRLAYRDVSAVGNAQALIAAVVPADVVTTHTLYCLKTSVPIEQQHFLCAMFNSYAINACVRLLMGGHVTTGLVESLPVPLWRGDATDRRIASVAKRLANGPVDGTVTADLQAAAAHRLALDADDFRTVLTATPLADPARALAWDAFRQHAHMAEPS